MLGARTDHDALPLPLGRARVHLRDQCPDIGVHQRGAAPEAECGENRHGDEDGGFRIAAPGWQTRIPRDRADG